jgi:hypothetical protein
MPVFFPVMKFREAYVVASFLAGVSLCCPWTGLAFDAIDFDDPSLTTEFTGKRSSPVTYPDCEECREDLISGLRSRYTGGSSTNRSRFVGSRSVTSARTGSVVRSVTKSNKSFRRSMKSINGSVRRMNTSLNRIRTSRRQFRIRIR